MSHRTARRTIRRTYRRTYVYPAIARLFGWAALGVFVALVSGLGAVTMGTYLDNRDEYPTPPSFARTVECPTEDSCVWGWDGESYGWMPVTP